MRCILANMKSANLNCTPESQKKFPQLNDENQYVIH